MKLYPSAPNTPTNVPRLMLIVRHIRSRKVAVCGCSNHCPGTTFIKGDAWLDVDVVLPSYVTLVQNIIHTLVIFIRADPRKVGNVGALLGVGSGRRVAIAHPDSSRVVASNTLAFAIAGRGGAGAAFLPKPRSRVLETLDVNVT